MSDSDSSTNEVGWERRILEKIALDGLAEQRRRRRWGIFFKLVGVVYAGVLLAVLLDLGGEADKLSDGKRHTAVITLDGVIQAKGEISSDNVLGALQSAFKDEGTAGIILAINSPGGSPV